MKKYIAKEMIKRTVGCKVPIELVPKCPVCGEAMDVNLRKDAYFVQDNNWYEQSRKYEEFLDMAETKNVVLLEFGVGFNTPGIIRFPFEKMTYQNQNWNLVRFNKENCDTYLDINERTIEVKNDINEIVSKLLNKEGLKGRK